MYNLKRLFKGFFCILLTLIMVLSFNLPKACAEKNKKAVTILFTHDMHDHVLPFNIEQNGKTEQLGGYARLKSAIQEEKKSDPDLLLVDAGDFSMGTLFQTIYTSDAPELRIMGQMGYDVTTFGNHEFDFRADGLADSLNAAKNSGDKLPQIVASNIIFPKDENGNLSKSLTNLKQTMGNYGVKDYTIIERNGIKIGVFGLMGKEADSCAPMAEVKFDDAVKNAKDIVNTLKQKEKADLIICLSHSGTSEKKSESEDEILAKKVPDIDVIISGHSHTKLDKPIIVGKTIIASCGEYCENLGTMHISQDPNKGWNLDDYNLKQIDNSFEDDMQISQTINGFKGTVQEKYLNNFGLKFDEVLAYSPFNFVPTADIGKKHAEDPLGNLITDAYIYAVKKAEGPNYEPVAMAVTPSGTIRNSFVKGNITVSDAFNVSSLGVGADKIAGYPLISVYLTGKELKTTCEVDASISPLMPTAQLYMSGLNFTFNPKRFILNKVTNSTLEKADGSLEEIDDEKLYRVVAGLYSAQMLSVVGEKSHGILSIVPKDKDGKPITDYERQIIVDNYSGHNNEVKEWLAVAEYLKSFDKVNDVAQVPERYNKMLGRKVVDNSTNIAALLGSPNSIALTAYAIIAAIIIIILIIVMTAKHKKRKKESIIQIDIKQKKKA